MTASPIEDLRHVSRKLVRELGIFQLSQSRSGKHPQHWHALIEISKEAEITISQLANLLLLSVSATSRIVNTLQKEGLVITATGTDKREKVLKLTPQGGSEIKIIDEYSYAKIRGAFEYLSPQDQAEITQAIRKYGEALESSRLSRDQVKIVRLSKSKAIRKQIIQMVEHIQREELLLDIPVGLNDTILRAEPDFYYDNSCNFWYATDSNGFIIGSIGLKKINSVASEIKKFFVKENFRGKGVAQKLILSLLKAAGKHGFQELYLGTVEATTKAHRFYEKYGFKRVPQIDLPTDFVVSPLDTVFYKANHRDVLNKMKQAALD